MCMSYERGEEGHSEKLYREWLFGLAKKIEFPDLEKFSNSV